MLTPKIAKQSFNRTTKALAAISKNAVPQAVRATLNDMAFDARKAAIKKIEQIYVLRNKFTARQVAVNKTRARDIASMKAETGHTQAYMAMQEKGGRIRGRRKFKPIPTRNARIGGSRKKMVRKPLRLGNLKLSGNKKAFFGKTKKGRQGIFGKKRKQVVMLWDMSRTQVTIKPTRWLSTSSRRAASPRRAAILYRRQATRIIEKRTGVRPTF